jgi:hypothetical protein
VLPPPVTSPRELVAEVRARGFAALDPAGFLDVIGARRDELDAIVASWSDLPADPHLRDGGRYRRRRHASFVVVDGEAILAPHRPHWQPIDYNALHGGFERLFEPIAPEVTGAPAWRRMLVELAARCSSLAGEQRWFVEAHQFRIDTTDGIGRPTPEGAHRDGVDFVFVTLIERRGVKGGETRVFDADGPQGIRFTMTEPFTTLVLDDARKLHETTPIQPLEAGGHRDTLVLTLRAGAFQGPPDLSP